MAGQPVCDNRTVIDGPIEGASRSKVGGPDTVARLGLPSEHRHD